MRSLRGRWGRIYWAELELACAGLPLDRIGALTLLAGNAALRGSWSYAERRQAEAVLRRQGATDASAIVDDLVAVGAIQLLAALNGEAPGLDLGLLRAMQPDYPSAQPEAVAKRVAKHRAAATTGNDVTSAIEVEVEEEVEEEGT